MAPARSVTALSASRWSPSSAIWLIVNFFQDPTGFINVVLIGLTNGAVYGLVALGYTLVYGILQLINFAHGDVFALGGPRLRAR